MSVDLTKIKPGDGLTLHVTERFVHSDAVTVSMSPVDGELVQFPFPPREFASHTPKPIAVGDRVRIGYMPSSTATVRAVIGERAWVDLTDDGQPLNGIVAGLSDLERVS